MRKFWLSVLILSTLAWLPVLAQQIPFRTVQSSQDPTGPLGLLTNQNGGQEIDLINGPTTSSQSFAFYQTVANNVRQLLFTISPAGAQFFVPLTGSNLYYTSIAGSVTIRPANTTTYTANSTVCAATCVAGTIPIASGFGAKGLITRVTLLKSGPTTAAATFTIWFFSAAPGLATPTQLDGTSYTGPRIADLPNYIGNATCTTPIATSDTSSQLWYECVLSNPNTSGALPFQALTGSLNINYLISVTAAYTPSSGETFTPYVSGAY